MKKKRTWIKNVTIEKRKQIAKKLKEGNYLPFYKKSGTSIFTCRIPADFEELWFDEEEMNHYIEG